jgi:hypothetical protein
MRKNQTNNSRQTIKSEETSGEKPVNEQVGLCHLSADTLNSMEIK